MLVKQYKTVEEEFSAFQKKNKIQVSSSAKVLISCVFRELTSRHHNFRQVVTQQ